MSILPDPLKQTALDASGLVWFHELYNQYLRLRPRLIQVDVPTGRLNDESAQPDQPSATIDDSIARLKNEIEELKAKHQTFGAELSAEQKKQKTHTLEALKRKLKEIRQAFDRKLAGIELTETEKSEIQDYIADLEIFIIHSQRSKSPIKFKQGGDDSKKDVPSSASPEAPSTEPAQPTPIPTKQDKQADVPESSAAPVTEPAPLAVDEEKKLTAEPATEKVSPIAGEGVNAMFALDALAPEKHPILYQQHLFDLENWLLVVLQREDLQERLEVVRGEYQEVFGTEAWVKVLPTLQAELKPEKESENRAEARRLQGELHWQASIRPWAAKKRESLTALVLALLIFLVLLAGVIKGVIGMNLAVVLLLVGALGGTVGSIQRIQTADLANSRAFDLARHAALQIGVIIAPLLGGIFALLLALFIFSNSVPSGFIIPDVKVSCWQTGGCDCSNSATNAACSVKTNAPLVAETNHPTTWKTSLLTNTSSARWRWGWRAHQTTSMTNLPTNTSQTASGALNACNTRNSISNVLPASIPTNNSAATNGMATAKKGQETEKPGKSEGCKYEFFTLQVTFASGKDLVLMVLLAFVAGFSERLVPDLLTKLADQKKS